MDLKLHHLLAAAVLVASAPAFAQAPAAIVQALASTDRPAADREQDARRKAAEILAFAEVQPGDKVADIYAGGGYFTRAFAKAVGPTGKVYAVFSRETPQAQALTTAPGFSNVALIVRPWNAFAAPEPLDLVFNSQFYHDLYNPQYGGEGGAAAHNRAVFAALKPGGVYLIVDHAAETGSGLRDHATTHRIDEEAVKRDITAAGFVFEGSSPVLRNPQDARTTNVFDPSIRGRTDQLVLKFRKPAR
jgi:predicted methyltransferase